MISEHEPRKGTETVGEDGERRCLHDYFRTRTPKGDGNIVCEPSLHPRDNCISEHEPRKGTETPYSLINVPRKAISEHEPRKGTETPRPRAHGACVRAISEHEPRKGTETAAISGKSPFAAAFQNTNPERGRKRRDYSPC